jgi:hypothetical protein
MSKFIERLQQVLTPPSQSMGFKTAKSEQVKPRIQLVVNVTGGNLKSQTKELDEADALVLPISAVGTGKTISGMWLSKGDAEEVEKSIKSGADFIILPADAEVLPPDKKIGKILQIEASITDVLLRTVNELPVDAVLLTEGHENGLLLTWKRLMLIQRFSSLLNKSLLIEVLPSITDTELQAIWEAGVSGIIVTADAEQAEAVMQSLRKVIDKLSFPSRRKREKSLAIVPQIENKPEEPEKEDDDDGDDE